MSCASTPGVPFLHPLQKAGSPWFSPVTTTREPSGMSIFTRTIGFPEASVPKAEVESEKQWAAVRKSVGETSVPEHTLTPLRAAPT